MITKDQFISSTQSEINSFSGPYAEEKKGMAKDMLSIGLDWIAFKQCDNVPRNVKRTKRRAYKSQLKEYISSNYNHQQVVGFAISSVVFWFIFRWVLSWVVNKLIDDYLIEI